MATHHKTSLHHSWPSVKYTITEAYVRAVIAAGKGSQCRKWILLVCGARCRAAGGETQMRILRRHWMDAAVEGRLGMDFWYIVKVYHYAP